MIQEIISKLLEKTENGELSWMSTSAITMFKTLYEKRLFSIEKKQDSVYELAEWAGDGTIPVPITFHGGNAELLYNKILETYPEFKNKLDEIDARKSGEKMNEPISLLKIKKQLGLDRDGANHFINIKKCNSFYYEKNPIPNYVEPFFVRLNTYRENIPLEKANVILISAPGATGKSALSAHLSNKMGIPLFDLGKHNAVGANSLTGLFVNYLPLEEYAIFMNGLIQNRFSMIIDGLDEGEIHSGGTKSYWSFLDDIVNIAKKAEGTPFLMLGRYRTVMDTAFYLEENDVKVVCLQIEPFTLNGAKEFIDKTIENKDSILRFEQSYSAVKNYIIDSIEGFFKNESESKKSSFNRFIGYAPVLMAISSLLNERQDFNKLLIELKSVQKTNINLLIDIIEKILDREQCKVRSQAIPSILEGYNVKPELSENIVTHSYGLDEQCARIIHLIMHDHYEYSICSRDDVNHSYNEKMDSWTENHPFLDYKNPQNPKFQNIVFESYVIARLAQDDNYSKTLIDYLELSQSNSYLLFDFFNLISNETRYLNHKLICYMYDSFRALDTNQPNNTLEVVSVTDESEVYDNLGAECELTFFRGNSQSNPYIDFITKIPLDEELELPSSLNGMMIDIPLPAICNKTRMDIMSPMQIRCTKLTIKSADIVISNGISGEKSVIECDELVTVQNNGKLPHVIRRGKENTLAILANKNVTYPFSDYYHGQPNLSKEDPLLYDKYQKLRRTIILFRAYGKENLARIQGKIESRISNTKIGRAVVNKLLSTGIIYIESRMYVLNTDKMNDQLGLTYNDIHSEIINDKTRAYLENIQV